MTLDPRRWPLSVSVPLAVATLMVVAGIGASALVLDGLARIQKRHLRALAHAYLDGIAATIVPHVERRDIWATFDVLDRVGGDDAGLSVRQTAVVLPSQVVLAAADPIDLPTLRPLPEAWGRRFGEGGWLAVDAGDRVAWARRELGGGAIGSVVAEFDIGELVAQRRRTLTSLLAWNLLLSVTLALAGYAAVRRLLGPLRRLSLVAAAAARDDGETWPDAGPPPLAPELRTLFDRYADLRRVTTERRTMARQLREQTHVAQIGRLATGLAHEVNNPLGGLLTAVDTLRRHGAAPEVRDRHLDLLERGLQSITPVVVQRTPNPSSASRASSDSPMIGSSSTSSKRVVIGRLPCRLGAASRR